MASLRKNDRAVSLGHRPGKRIRSGVFNPLDDTEMSLSLPTSSTLSTPSTTQSSSTLKSGSSDTEQTMVDLDDEDLEIEEKQVMEEEVSMVDLDSD